MNMSFEVELRLNGAVNALYAEMERLKRAEDMARASHSEGAHMAFRKRCLVMADILRMEMNYD